MKTSNDPIVHLATDTTAASASRGQSARSTGLKLLIGIAAVTAASLTYQVVAETIVLHKLMDKTMDSVAVKFAVQHPTKNASAHPDSKSFETNGGTAVLLN